MLLSGGIIMYNSYISKSYQAQNLQKKQSMTAFANALIELMKTKNLEKIQVSELCCKADYSRRTYYRLFQSKEDILYFYIDNLCMEYYHLFFGTTDTSLSGVSNIFFKYWYQQKDFLALLHANQLDSLLLERFSKLLPQVYLSKEKTSITTKDDKSRYYMAIFCAGGFCNLLLSWMQNNFEDSPEYMSTIVHHIMEME